jgi:hypothetical protein
MTDIIGEYIWKMYIKMYKDISKIKEDEVQQELTLFENLEEYIKKSKEERQNHLDLSEPCIEIGGESDQFRGLLAHYLNTTIQKIRKIHLCHACHNKKCSNVKHLYWGTARENRLDAKMNGAKSIWTRTVEKYGDKKAREIFGQNFRNKRMRQLAGS